MYKKYKPRRGKTAAVAAAVPKIWWFLRYVGRVLAQKSNFQIPMFCKC